MSTAVHSHRADSSTSARSGRRRPKNTADHPALISEVQPVNGQRRGGERARFAPDHPAGNGDHDVEERPRGREQPVRRLPGGLGEPAIPFVRLEEGAGTRSGETQADEDEETRKPIHELLRAERRAIATSACAIDFCGLIRQLYTLKCQVRAGRLRNESGFSLRRHCRPGRSQARPADRGGGPGRRRRSRVRRSRHRQVDRRARAGRSPAQARDGRRLRVQLRARRARGPVRALRAREEGRGQARPQDAAGAHARRRSAARRDGGSRRRRARHREGARLAAKRRSSPACWRARTAAFSTSTK